MRHRFFYLSFLILTLQTALARADAFDHYTNPILSKAVSQDGVQEVKELTPALLSDNDHVLAGVDGAVVFVRTNDNRHAKLVVRAAYRKVGDKKKIPLLLIDRFVTYKEGEERTIFASGNNVGLFSGFRFNLDLGQIVPEDLGGDLRFVVDGDKVRTETIGKAKMWLLTKPLAAATPKKGDKLEVGENFEVRYYNGTYKLYDDGRRSGKLVLKVDDAGEMTGSYYSDKDGSKYEVIGHVGKPTHSFQFTVKFPRSEQSFQGWLFTGDAKALVGSSKLQERETGFYAVRVEE